MPPTHRSPAGRPASASKTGPDHLAGEAAGSGSPWSPTPKARIVMSDVASVPRWVFGVNLPDRLVRALVAAHLFAERGVWHAGAESARALGVTDRTLRSWCACLVAAGLMHRIGRANYRLGG